MNIFALLESIKWLQLKRNVNRKKDRTPRRKGNDPAEGRGYDRGLS
jgi:hypothetical protein